MKIVSREEAKKLDKQAISMGIDESILMENAGCAVFDFLKMYLGLDKKYLIFAGMGNNGGDAFVVARKLASEFAHVVVFIVGEKNQIKGIALKNLDLLHLYPVEILQFNTINRVVLSSLLEADVIIDGIFGTGLNREIEGTTKELILEINNSKKPVVAIDIPSGVDANTGAILGIAVKADFTITMGLPKRGFYSPPGCDYTGKVIVSHISYPPELTLSKDIHVETRLIEPFEDRPTDSHKGTFGRALFISGSKTYFGAPYFNALAFLKSGGGLSYLGTTESVGRAIIPNANEVVLLPLKETKNGTIAKENIKTILKFAETVDIVSIGSGLSIDGDTEELVLSVIKNVEKPVIVDGDGLTILSKHKEVLKERKFETILTPHLGEFSRLIGVAVEDIKKDRFSYLFKAMTEFNCSIVLKGAFTLIGSKGDIYVNTSGNPVLATAGSGDILVGVIASCIIRKKNVTDGLILAVYLHGLSADLIKEEISEEGITSKDILEHLKITVKKYKEDFKAIKGGNYECKGNF